MTSLPQRTSIFARALLVFVRAYRLLLSPILPPACRFEPTCSRYAEEAVRVHGAWRGTWLTLGRLLRCRPGGGKGYDPVPIPRRTNGTEQLGDGDRPLGPTAHSPVSSSGASSPPPSAPSASPPDSAGGVSSNSSRL